MLEELHANEYSVGYINLMTDKERVMEGISELILKLQRGLPDEKENIYVKNNK